MEEPQLPESSQQSATDQTHFDEDFADLYANNFSIEPSVWDIRVIFGQLSAGKKGIEWHTGVTMPWAVVKLLIYYLKINLAIHESDYGNVLIPPSMLPGSFAEPSGDSDPPQYRAFYEWAMKERARMWQQLPVAEMSAEEVKLPALEK